MRKWWAIAVPALLCLSACAPTTETGPGIVSTSLCGDTYVAASGRDVAALSWQAGGPLSRETATKRQGWADAETLIAMQPDVLVLGPGDSVVDALLPKTQIIELDWSDDVEGIQANAAKLGFAVPLPEASVADGAPTLFYLSRAGGTAGRGTYVDTAIRLAGARNLVDSDGWFTPDPEWIVGQNPDYVLTSFFDAYESVNASGARNRAVRQWMAARPRIDVPGKLWPCGGPGLAEAVDLIRDGIR